MPRTDSPLDLQRVVDAALSIADADGLDRLSMRRLSAVLGVTPMAIYHHVQGKEELLDIVADESLRALPLFDRGAPCAAELERIFVAMHGLYLDHPALAEALAGRPLEGPRAVELGETVLQLLVTAGVAPEVAAGALLALTEYTVGASLYRVSRRRARAARGERLTHITAEAAPLAHALRGQLSAAGDDDAQFADGLRRLIGTYVPA